MQTSYKYGPLRQTYLLAVSLSFAIVYNIPKFFEQKVVTIEVDGITEQFTQ